MQFDENIHLTDRNESIMWAWALMHITYNSIVA